MNVPDKPTGTVGGAREGAGRPKDSKNIKSARAAVLLASDGGETPFSIMLKTARELWRRATVDDPTGRVGPDKEHLLLAREAASVAKDCAPYVHPRLSNITLENADDEPFVIRFDREDRDA